MTPTQRKAMQDAIDYIRSTADYKMGSPAACETVCDLHEALAEPEPVPLLTDDEIHDVWMIARVANEFPTVYALEFAHSRIEQLETALSECRDAMPSPAPGERQEQSWSEAIGDPLAVPAYVKETMARLERELSEANKPPTGTAPCARFCEHTAFLIEARQHKAAIQQLERENAELRKDAERYRWLRDQNGDLESGFCVGDETDTLPEDITWIGSDLDAAIDAAMQKEQS